jgi:ATP-dependent Clp endopeptidase proteolytic subunit ClpP
MAKRTWFTAQAAVDSEGAADIAIYDEIGGWGVGAGDFRDALDALGPVKKIDLRLNSPGGDVFDGLAIYNMLQRHPAEVGVTVDGIAASIASLVAMAGDTITMPENALMMIHNPSGMAMGEAADMDEVGGALRKVGQAMAATYARRTGQTPEAIGAMMDARTWMTAQEAKDNGFADQVSAPVQMAARFDPRKLLPGAPAAISAKIIAAYDPDNDGDDDALEAIGYIGQAIDSLADAVGCLTGTGDEDDTPRPATTALRKALAAMKLRAAAENWTVGAARDLPIDEADGWDGPAAAERMLDEAGFNGDSPDSAKARRGFLVYDSSAPKLKGSYKEPFADFVGGELRAMAGGLRAAAQRLPQTKIPDDVKSRAQAVLDAYDKRRQKPNASAAAEIAAACQLAGFADRTAEYLLAGKSLAQVRSELQALKADQGRAPGEHDVSGRNNRLPGFEVHTASWAKALEKINARSGF